MRLILTIVCLFLVAACDGPSPEFRGIDGRSITVDGSDFIVRIKGDRAEAVRTNFEPRSEFRAVMARAIVAIETVSACQIATKTSRNASVILYEQTPGIFEGDIEYGEWTTGLDLTGDPALIKAGLDCR